MSKVTDVLIIDANTLRLEVDAKKGDEIDLRMLNKVDTSNIVKEIELQRDSLYNQKLNELKEVMNKEFDYQKTLALNKLEKEFNEKLISSNNEKEKLELEIKSLKEKIKDEITLALLNKEKEMQENISNLEKEINRLNNELKTQSIISQSKLNEVVSGLKEENRLKVDELEKQLSNLKLEKSALNVKKLGEQLETWCNNEYTNYSQLGFLTCSWEKDNISIKEDGELKGTKADYIFKVFATEEKLPNQLLTSVACEMKNEDPNSSNKKKNSDHYKKLDSDRRKKNCEYALLVSELEWDSSNDVPIKRVMEYEKMYVVRPQYFITFLSIICSLGLKFKELLLEENKREEQFRDKEEIKAEFELFKTKLLDKPIKNLEKEVESIKKSAGEIIKLSNKINTSADEVIVKAIEQIKKQIENFNISKLVKKIDKIDK